MVDAPAPSALARKIACHAQKRPQTPDLCDVAARLFGRALRHAAAPYDGLGLLLGDVAMRNGLELEDATAALPEKGLIAVLEDGSGRRGLLAVSPGLIDALIEVQTSGRVEPLALQPRPVTRIDEALVRDFLDMVLAAFAREGAGLEGRNWPDRMRYGSRVADRGQINLFLPDGQLTLFDAEIRFEGVDRHAQIVMALPVIPARLSVDGAGQPRGKVADAAWIAARDRIVAELPLPLYAVLLRTKRPLREVEALNVGDLLPFSAAQLDAVGLETAHGRRILTGRLGQNAGLRAIRLPRAEVPAAVQAAHPAQTDAPTPMPEPVSSTPENTPAQPGQDTAADTETTPASSPSLPADLPGGGA